MAFLVESPIEPMLAKRSETLPTAGQWSFEPKWDGFRVLVFRNGDELLLQSRDLKALDRYFPEVREALLKQLPQRCVLDGEIVLVRSGANGVRALDFDALSLRIHPATSRVRLLAEQTPASIVFFDLLALVEEDLRGVAFVERRRRLEEVLRNVHAPVYMTPATREIAVAERWFADFEGAGLDGVMAKPLDGAYQPGKRAMLKIKHERDCDCVVAGFRWHKDGQCTAVGSLLLGLFDAEGTLHHVGVCASFTAAKRLELAAMLEPYRENALRDHPWAGWAEATGDGQRMPGGKSRWTGTKDLSWEPVRTELVVEVAYEHMQGDRFRHLAHMRRFRVDKTPSDCTYAQLEVVPPLELQTIFAD